jgi:farnesyl diphosphate synthase
MKENMPNTYFETQLLKHSIDVEDVLDQILSQTIQDGEITRPTRLLNAMRHGVLNGGKRLRPFVLVQSAKLFDKTVDQHSIIRVAAALECVHCYSLIHDDLPAMDDDDIRRGQPTVHRVFGEAHAILAGDGLLTLAFDIIADKKTDLSPTVKVELMRLLARASGIGGMAGGQSLDLEAEKTNVSEADIIRLQAMKTGALIRFACEAGALIGNAPNHLRALLAEYGSSIGLAFQIADDLLDINVTFQQMGKETKKDASRHKGTLPQIHGEQWATKQLNGLVNQAIELLTPFGADADILSAIADFIAKRQH